MCRGTSVALADNGGPRLESPKMLLSPHRETYWSRIGWIVQNFQILIVYAVNVCKQCLQTAAASADYVRLSPRPPKGASSLDPTIGRPLGYRSQMKIPYAATVGEQQQSCALTRNLFPTEQLLIVRENSVNTRRRNTVQLPMRDLETRSIAYTFYWRHCVGVAGYIAWRYWTVVFLGNSMLIYLFICMSVCPSFHPSIYLCLFAESSASPEGKQATSWQLYRTVPGCSNASGKVGSQTHSLPSNSRKTSKIGTTRQTLKLPYSLARLSVYVIYYPAHCAGATNMSRHYNLFRWEDISPTLAYKL